MVAEAAEESGPLHVALLDDGGTLHVTVEGDVDWGERLVRLEDRVGAASGSVARLGTAARGAAARAQRLTATCA